MTSRTPALPPLPDRGLLADLCREAAERERVQAVAVEKDFYLTRVLWALAQVMGNKLLLKGGTLLSKVDVGFRRMSEDADLVLPGAPSRQRRDNVVALNEVRAALRTSAGVIGVRLPYPDGEHHDKGAHRLWKLDYDSEFGAQSVSLEVSRRPVLRTPRRMRLGQLLVDELIGSYEAAFSHALSEDEGRAEKVRAAFTREAIRDFYDLEQLDLAGKDFTSAAFIELVDAKLAELGAEPLAKQGAGFGMNSERRKALEASLAKELPAVLRTDAPRFDLDATLSRFDALWGKRP